MCKNLQELENVVRMFQCFSGSNVSSTTVIMNCLFNNEDFNLVYFY
jgi:hypothetical protein